MIRPGHPWGKPSRKAVQDGKAYGLALVVVWAPADGGRLGEVMNPRTGAVFGRGPVDERSIPSELRASKRGL